MSERYELRTVKKNPNAIRPASRATEGYDRDLLFDRETGRTLGPSESQRITPKQAKKYYQDNTTRTERFLDSELTRNAVEVGTVVLTQIIIEHGLPIVWEAGKRGVSKLIARRSTQLGEKAPPTVLPTGSSAQVEGHLLASKVVPKQELNDAASDGATKSELAKPGLRMSSDEYLSRLLLAGITDQFSTDQHRILVNAQLDDGGDREQLEQQVRELLEDSNVVLDEAMFMNLLEAARRNSARNVPLELGRIDVADKPKLLDFD